MSDMVWMILAGLDLAALLAALGYLVYRIEQEMRKEHAG